MSWSASAPDVQCPPPEATAPYRPSTPEIQHALTAVLKAHPREYLCCVADAPGAAQIGYWRRGPGLLGPNYFIAVGAGRTVDEAVLAAAQAATCTNSTMERSGTCERPGGVILSEKQSRGEPMPPKASGVGRHRGYVREWRDEGRGFGKIYGRLDAAERGENFFFHMSSVKNPRALAKGVKVSFDISPVQSGTHRRAVNVEVVG